MSIDDNTSENAPVIKSRTGKFLQGMFDKKASGRNMPNQRSTPTSQQEFMQVVPEPITWDEGEETNWDDDFIEAPQPAFEVPTEEKSVEEKSVEKKISVTPAPPPPPPREFKTVKSEPIAEGTSTEIAPTPPKSLSDLSQPAIHEPIDSLSATFPAEIAPHTPPRSTVAKADEVTRPSTIEVSIPRPKNIKYKSKDPNAETISSTSAKPNTTKNEAIDLDIQRPKNIKYKTTPLVKPSLPERLLAPFKSLVAKISAPFDQTPKIYIEQVPADGKIPVKNPVKKSWQLPSLGSENFRQILVIAGAVFLAMTVAWAVINFSPRSHSVALTPPAPVVQPVVPIKPVVSPEAALVEAVKNRSQVLASLYPPGLITNLELDNKQGLATVTVGDLWFSLTLDQQQQTAQSLWQQARNYQMSGLEVRGTTDRLLARSPFIGTEAILTSQ
jgi:hypothetical protein